MKKVNYIAIFSCLSLFSFFSCNSSENKSLENKNYKEEWTLLNSSDYSKLSLEQKKEKIKLGKYFLENIKVIDNKLILNLTRDNVLKLGFPNEYYDFCLNDLDDINTMEDPILKQSFMDAFNETKKESLRKISELELEIEKQ
jgi:hypothetical protein